MHIFIKTFEKVMDKNLLKLLRKFTIAVKLTSTHTTFSTVKLKLNRKTVSNLPRIQEQQVAQICTCVSPWTKTSRPRFPLIRGHSGSSIQSRLKCGFLIAWKPARRSNTSCCVRHTVLCNADILRSFIVSARDSAPPYASAPPLYVSPSPAPSQ